MILQNTTQNSYYDDNNNDNYNELFIIARTQQ